MIGQLKMNERLHGQHDPKLDVVRICVSPCQSIRKRIHYVLQTSNINYIIWKV